jgi:hypothetical protein
VVEGDHLFFLVAESTGKALREDDVIAVGGVSFLPCRFPQVPFVAAVLEFIEDFG